MALLAARINGCPSRCARSPFLIIFVTSLIKLPSSFDACLSFPICRPIRLAEVLLQRVGVLRCERAVCGEHVDVFRQVMNALCRSGRADRPLRESGCRAKGP